MMIELPKSEMEAIRDILAKAQQIVSDMSSEKFGWVLEDYDPDSLIFSALSDAETLLARVEALEKANAEERGVWSQLYNELSGDATGSYSMDDLRRVVAKAVGNHSL